MYDQQVTLYVDPQIEKKQGFLQTLPYLWLQGASFTYHVKRWRLEYLRTGRWFEHEFLHSGKLEMAGTSNLVILVRRRWLREADEFMYHLVEKWLKGHPERRLTIVTDTADGLKLSKFHARTLTDMLMPVMWSNRYKGWRKSVERSATWAFRSPCVLLDAFALMESRRGRYVSNMESLVAPGSLLVDSLLRSMSAGPLRKEEFPLHGITHKMVRSYLMPFLSDKQDIETILSAVMRQAEESRGDTIPPVELVESPQGRLLSWERDAERLVNQCVV